MSEAFICEGTRTPIGKFGGSLSSIRTDDLASLPLISLKEKLSKTDWENLEEVFYGNANQAGEDNRNIARMALLLAGLPHSVPGITLNRLCASGMEAISSASRMIKSNEADMTIAGGAESMSRAPFVMPKANSAFSRNAEIYDTTIGWRFVNPKMKENFGIDSMPETAENVAEKYQITRNDQDNFALNSQKKAIKAISENKFKDEIVPIKLKDQKIFDKDEYPRSDTNLEKLSNLKTVFKENGTVTAGNASGLNDGAAAVTLMNYKTSKDKGLKPIAKIVSWSQSGVDPKLMGTGPIPASKLALKKAGWNIKDLDLVESNEAFAAQSIAVIKELGLKEDIVNVNGGAIALGHPIGASGARILVTLVHEMQKRKYKKGLATLCIGGGMGISMCVESI